MQVWGARGLQKHFCCFFPACPKDTDSPTPCPHLIFCRQQEHLSHASFRYPAGGVYSLHFTDEEPKAQRGQTTCPMSHNPRISGGTLLGLKPRLQEAIPPGLLKKENKQASLWRDKSEVRGKGVPEERKLSQKPQHHLHARTTHTRLPGQWLLGHSPLPAPHMSEVQRGGLSQSCSCGDLVFRVTFFFPQDYLNKESTSAP